MGVDLGDEVKVKTIVQIYYLNGNYKTRCVMMRSADEWRVSKQFESCRDGGAIARDSSAGGRC